MSLGVTHACQSVFFYIYRPSFIILTSTYVSIMPFYAIKSVIITLDCFGFSSEFITT